MLKRIRKYLHKIRWNQARQVRQLGAISGSLHQITAQLSQRADNLERLTLAVESLVAMEHARLTHAGQQHLIR